MENKLFRSLYFTNYDKWVRNYLTKEYFKENAICNAIACKQIHKFVRK